MEKFTTHTGVGVPMQYSNGGVPQARFADGV